MTNDTNETSAGQGIPFAAQAGASFALIETPDMVDKLVGLGIQAHGLEITTLEMPAAVHGLPKSIQAIAKHGVNGVSFEKLRPFFEEFRTAPERRKGTATVTTLLSFIALVERHKDHDSAIFAKTAWPDPKLTAVIDYHTTIPATDDGTFPANGEPGGYARFCEHKIVYSFPLTEEFKAWMAMNGKPMEQAEFALFLEEHVDDLASPLDAERTEYEHLFKERIAAPNELVALARNLEIHVGQKIKRAERIQTGERTVVFESSHTNNAGETVDIPGIFMISVAPFVDGDPVRLPARLRYRLKGGEIIWFYQLYRPEFWLRAQVQNDLLEVATATGLPTYEGAPEL